MASDRSALRQSEIDSRKIAAFEARLNTRPPPRPLPVISKSEKRVLLGAARRRRARLVRGDTVREVVNRAIALCAAAGPLNDLAAEVATRHGILVVHLVSPERYKSDRVTAARYEFLRLVRDRFRVVTDPGGSRRCVPAGDWIGKPLSLPLLSELAGYCNHTALVYSMKREDKARE